MRVLLSRLFGYCSVKLFLVDEFTRRRFERGETFLRGDGVYSRSSADLADRSSIGTRRDRCKSTCRKKGDKTEIGCWHPGHDKNSLDGHSSRMWDGISAFPARPEPHDGRYPRQLRKGPEKCDDGRGFLLSRTSHQTKKNTWSAPGTASNTDSPLKF